MLEKQRLMNDIEKSAKHDLVYKDLSIKISYNIKLIQELENIIKPDLEIFIEKIKENNHTIEIEVYNYTTKMRYIFIDIDKFNLFMNAHRHHEVTIENLVINGYVIESNLPHNELSNLIDNKNPALVNEIMNQTGLSVEKSVELFDDGFKTNSDDEISTFKEWFKIYRSETYKQILELKMISGVQGSEIYIDWYKVCTDYKFNRTINIFNIGNDYIIC